MSLTRACGSPPDIGADGASRHLNPMDCLAYILQWLDTDS